MSNFQIKRSNLLPMGFLKALLVWFAVRAPRPLWLDPLRTSKYACLPPSTTVSTPRHLHVGAWLKTILDGGKVARYCRNIVLVRLDENRDPWTVVSQASLARR